MATRSAPCAFWAWRAAIAALLKKQKPIAVDFSAWWPGGREATKTLSALPVKTSSTAAMAPPTARQRRLQAFRARIGVGFELIDLALFLRHLAHDRQQVLFRMSEQDSVLCSPAAPPFRSSVAKFGCSESDVDGPQSVGPLGVAGGRDVFQEDRMLVKAGAHGVTYLSVSVIHRDGVGTMISTSTPSGGRPVSY